MLTMSSSSRGGASAANDNFHLWVKKTKLFILMENVEIVFGREGGGFCGKLQLSFMGWKKKLNFSF